MYTRETGIYCGMSAVILNENSTNINVIEGAWFKSREKSEQSFHNELLQKATREDCENSSALSDWLESFLHFCSKSLEK